MIRYGLNVLGLSIIISVITAALVYFALNTLFVQPMMRITRNILRFSQNPEDASRIIVPSERQRRDRHRRARAGAHAGRADADPAAEEPAGGARAGGQQDQPRPAQHAGQRPAHLGPARQPARPDGAAVRAQADRLARPRHQLVREHAKFGRAEEAPPRREPTPLRVLVEDVGDGLGLPREDAIAWTVDIEDAAHRRRSRPAVPRAEQPVPQRPAGHRAAGLAKGQIPWSPAATAGASRSRCATTGRACRRRRAPTCSRPSRARRARADRAGLAVAQELVRAHGGSIRLLESARAPHSRSRSRTGLVMAHRPGGGPVQGHVYDLAIIGGGINGGAVARDAAWRGMSVFLCEKGDFASGSLALDPADPRRLALSGAFRIRAGA